MSNDVLSDYGGPEGAVKHIRDVALLPGESVTHVFSPEEGLTDEPPAAGQVLVTTNRRILAFCRGDGSSETFLVSVQELKGVAVKSGARVSNSLLQGLLLAAGGVFLYVAVAYWLAGRLDGPNIPVIDMDIGPFVVLIVALLSAAFVARYYFSKGDGTVTFQGNNWTFAFPYRGEKAGQEVYQVVNSVFAARYSDDGRPQTSYE